MSPDFLVGVFVGCVVAIALSELAWTLADMAVKQTAKAHLRRSSLPVVRR